MGRLLLTGLCVLFVVSAYAELQNVEVGGEIQLRGRYYRNGFTTGLAREARLPAGLFPTRAFGPFGLTSMFDLDDRGNDLTFVEQRTVLNVKADFTDDVSAFIELESFEWWGEDFRSNYITGADTRAVSTDDIEIYQSYIEVNDMFGVPVRLRIGRQEIVMGKKWLVGNRIWPTLGISHDGVRLTYTPGDFTLDAWWTKLVERSPMEEDGDVDFYGIYGTYSGFEPLSVSAYWLFIRDAGERHETQLNRVSEWFEDLAGVDDYDPVEMHTLGVRLWGAAGGFDYDLELAYQFGDADGVGFLYNSGFVGHGDDSARFDNWAADLEVGYTFDIAWQPRIFIGGVYMGGEDNREISFFDWLNPLYQPNASLSFNRIFSSIAYSYTIDLVGGSNAISNFRQIRGGITAHPTEAITAGLLLAYYEVDEPFDWPLYYNIGPFRIPKLPFVDFLSKEASDELGIMARLWTKYEYSEDLSFILGWERFFVDDGLEEGNFILKNGQDLLAGSDDDDIDYFWFIALLKF